MRPALLHLSEEQLDALRSAVRTDVYCSLEVLGPAPIKTIAKFIRRRPDAIYHHVRILEQVGLIRVVATQKSGKRDEAIYDRTADEIGLKPSPWDENYADAATRFISSFGRIFAEDCEGAVAKYAKTDAARAHLPAFLRRHRLKPEHFEELRQRIYDLDAWLTSVSTTDGEVYSVIAGAVSAVAKKSIE